ncbi:MAG: WXG100 family type VII secretion target [Jatrophihabitans sp.]
MSTLKVTPAQLNLLGHSAAGVSAEVRGQHQQLRARLSPLFGSEWVGTASAQFAALYENFDLHAKGLADALDGIGQLLVRAGGHYTEAEVAIAASFH